MAVKADFKLDGLKELRSAFSQLPDKIERRVIKGAVRSAATPIKTGMRKTAPVESGALSKSIQTVVRTYRQQSMAVAVVGPVSKWIKAPAGRWTKTGNINPALYAHLAEDGFTTRSGRKVAGTGFMEKSFQANVKKSQANLIKTMRRGIEREAAKLARK